jgi:isocitrate dehydrogenase
MMLRHLGWTEAADLVIKGIAGAIADRKMTYDLARLTENATELSCSGFAQAAVDRM